MTRLVDWRGRLAAAIEIYRRAPFAYGAADCALLALAAVEAQTGRDIVPAAWRRYHTELGALRVMRRAGFASLADMAASVLPEIHPSRAGLGDIMAMPVQGPFGQALGVCNGERVFVFGREHDGLGLVSRLGAVRAFRVS